MNFLASARARACEEFRGRAVLDQPAAMQQHDVAGEPPGLAEIVGRHHHLDAARGDGAHDVLDRLGGGGIEAGGRLVEKQHGRIARQRARQRQPLLLAAGQPPRRAALEACRARPARAVRRRASSRSARGTSGGGQRVTDIAGGAAPEHGRALEHDGAPRRRRRVASAPGDAAARDAGSVPWRRAAAWSCRRRSARSERSADRRRAYSETSSRMVTSPATMPTSANMTGRSEAGARMVIPRSVRRRGARPRPAR